MAKWNSKANDVFLRAAEVESPAERRLFLDQQCGGDQGLLAQVESLLAASEQVGSFLNKPAFQNLPGNRGTVDSQPMAEGPSTMIGPYKLLQQIGEGGMGVVYMAEQEQPVRRKVALKIVKSGLDTAQVIARFEAERQALALMDHPNIAKVLDAGTTESGRPYFVMELVKGIPITRFCDEHQLTPRQRLELFIPVCQAVQHAHQKGIIHRDLKPSNVLIALYDDQPVPKVIDFGVAKATSQKLTERTLFTAFGSFIGTLEYMSPEQAKLNALDIDTRSDVYALGVLLYELLTGNTPLEHERLKQTALDELLRIIREDEPPRPSTRLSYSGEKLATISAQRGTEPMKLGQVLRGELDWIVMRALEKERTRRYETANGLARDVERYLHDEPVEACPPTAGYKLRKFARKHKAGLATAAGFAALLLLGTAVSAWQAVRATQAETVAMANEQKANTNAVQAQQKEQEANQQRDEAQKQRNEVKALYDKLAAKEQQLQRTLYAAQLNLAQHAWEAGAMDQVLELLEQHRPKLGETDLRSFEWYYLDQLSHAAILTLKADWPSSVAYSPDGKRLASANGSHVKVWDAQTSQELLSLQGGGCKVVFSPDGKRLASGVNDRVVRVWDAQTGQKLLSLKVRYDEDLPGFGLAFSPDGKRLATACGHRDNYVYVDGAVKVWDAQTGQELLTVKGGVNTVAFSLDGKRLAGVDGSRGGAVKVWDAQTGQELLTCNGRHIGAVNSVVFSPDGQRLASAASDLKVWNAQTGEELFSIKEAGWTVVFSPDGKRLATSWADKTVKVWDARTGQQLFNIKGHHTKVFDAAFSPDGKRLASAAWDGTVRVWDAQTGQKPMTLPGAASFSGASVAFSPDGKRLASGGRNPPASGPGELKVWDVETGQEIFSLKGHTAKVTTVAYSPDGKRLASGAGDKTVKVWDAQTGQELLTFKGHAKDISSVAFSPDGKRLVSTSAGEPAKVWDSQTGREFLTLKEGGGMMVFSPDGNRLATGAGELKVWNAQTGQELLTLFKGFVSCVAFSPDGKRLVSAGGAGGGMPGEVKVWDAQTGQELQTLKGHSNFVYGVTFSPDGKRLASACRDKTVKLWDAQTGQELLTIKELESRVHSLAFSPDGKHLAGAAENGTVTIWGATPLPQKP
jgi:WD40 repeat protein/serine/threonine protein kinase